MREFRLWFGEALLSGGWAQKVRLTVAQGHVRRIETDVAPEADDERHAIALPGMPNLHSHAFQRAMAGLTERRGAGPDSFWSWRELMYRFTARIGLEELWAVAALAYMEMLEAGFTHVGEFHYLHHAPDGRPYHDPAEMVGAIGSAAIETGMGLTLLPVFYAHSGFGGAPPTEGQKRFVSTLDSYVQLYERCRQYVDEVPNGRLGVAPHSLRAVTEEELSVLSALAGDRPIHIHIAEQVREVEDCLAFTRQRPVEWLLDHCDVGPNWCLVHATHMTGDETVRLARSGAVAGLCPVTEANLGDGLFPAADYLGHGGRWGIGSDSNVCISLSEELRLLEYGQRLWHRARNVLARPGQSTGTRLYTEALAGGAKALGCPAGLVEGQPADIVSLKADHAALAGKTGDEILDSLVFAAGGSLVDRVWRYGRLQVQDGRHVLRDHILARYVRALEVLRA
ncbi:formimidoylglutamate deiminase [Asticcacaulis sp. AC402]|uniref:formimidoylglutamate deiminase n=1 Tax=Asticcacaulis sp. AC402 TaxID=1282361 RepID=UPI0003C3EBDA|nr:formimidoylglutamate deiminase [Asticcacaulis sp. AC402]ESQ75126.1 N-formimino-L-glutamate deiminase [Asticcacaulis sp. AC402]